MDVRFVNLVPTELNPEFSVKDIYSIYSYHYSPHFAYSGESHEPWELVYIQSGKVIVETDTYSVSLSTGNILLHKPFEPHRIKADNVACNIIILAFSVDKNEALEDIAGKILMAGNAETSFIMAIIYNGIDVVAGKNYSHNPQSSQSTCFSKFAAKQVVKNTLELLLIELKRSVISPSSLSLLLDNRTILSNNVVILSIINYLNDNLCEKIVLNDIAKKVGYSVSNISSIFKKYTGESIMSYFLKMKIGKACELLTEDKMPVKNISNYLKFGTVQYFCTQFKNLTGLTPLQFKKASKSSLDYFHIGYEDV